MATTIILKAIGTQSPALQDFLEGLGIALKERNFQVLGLPPRFSDGKLFRIWQANLLLVIADRSSDKIYLEPTLRFFYSLRKAEESLKFIAVIVQEMLVNRDGINYSLAKKWEHIIRPTYFKLLQGSDVPAVLLELHGPGIQEDLRKRLETRIVEGIARYFALGDSSSYMLEEDIEQSFLDMKERSTIVREKIDVKEGNDEEITPSLDGTNEDLGKVQEENKGYVTEMKSIEEETQEGVKKVSHNREKQLDKETPKMELHLTEAKLKRRPRYWGSNPLAPPGDGPIYYFEPHIPVEVPPAIPANIAPPTVPIIDPLSNLKDLALSLKRVTWDGKTK